jgi:predicted short-subunit dehydrogenase-like oxidoreductase (DUF2520 family)
VTLVGPGRAGKAFGRSWISAGGRILEVVARTPEDARKGAAAIGGGAPRILGKARCRGDVLAIAVPDDAVAQVAQALSSRFRGKLAFHLSGALPAAVLAPLKPSGAALASLHPARVFTGAAGETWKGAFVALEGEAGACAQAERIVAAVGGIPRRVSSTTKPLYHAAAAIAAGGTASLVALATRVWQDAGIPAHEARPALAALAGQAAAAVGRRGFDAGLTGPVARRDLGTLAAHADALSSRRELLDLYAILAREILERTPGRGREEEVRALLSPRKVRAAAKS